MALQALDSDPFEPTVFISYAHKDRPFAHALAAELGQRECNAWVDDFELRAGDSITERISNAVTSADFVITIISESSVASQWCRRELQIALNTGLVGGRTVVLPVKLGVVDLPASLADILFVEGDSENVPILADQLRRHMMSHVNEIRLHRLHADSEAVASRTAQLSLIQELVESEDPTVRGEAIRRLAVLNENYEFLSEDKSSLVRAEVAIQTSNTELLQKLAHDKSQEVRSVALAKLEDPGKLDDLAASESVAARLDAARHSTDEAVLADLSADGNPLVRRLAVERTRDQNLLRSLANDHDPEVRWVVAERTRDQSILEQLAFDSNNDIRIAAGNRITNRDILKRLARDHHLTIAERAIERLDTEERLSILSKIRRVGVQADTIRQLPPGTNLERWAANKNASIREAVAEATTDAGLLKRLATDPEGRVRARALARTDDLSLLKSAAKDRHSDVQLVLVDRLQDPKLVSKLVLRGNPEVARAALRKISDETWLRYLLDRVVDPTLHFWVAERLSDQEILDSIINDPSRVTTILTHADFSTRASLSWQPAISRDLATSWCRPARGMTLLLI